MNAVLKPSPEVLRDIAVEEHCNDIEEFSAWLQSVGDDREMSAFYGPISTPDLIRKIVLAPVATDAQYAAACVELRKRYLLDYAKAISLRILALEEQS
jgi:hypothetical protein